MPYTSPFDGSRVEAASGYMKMCPHRAHMMDVGGGSGADPGGNKIGKSSVVGDRDVGVVDKGHSFLK